MQGAVAAMIRAARLQTPRRSARAAGLAKLAAGLGTVALLMFSGSPPGRAPEPANLAAAGALVIDEGPRRRFSRTWTARERASTSCRRTISRL